jgi:hypothetical protein
LYYTVTSNTGLSATGGSSPITITGLTNGVAYTFTVTATNAIGTSTASATTNSVTPATVPDAPTISTATRGNGEATITFNAPGDNGGSPISYYTVTSNVGGFVAYGGSSPITITGLTNGQAYTFTVTATNAVGTSTASSATNSVTPATIPGAPTIGTATAGNGQATITFSAPVSNGGSAITIYTVTSNTGITATGGSSPITVTGLTNGQAYTFTVTASNALGTSTASVASNSVTPATVPDAPTNVAASIGDTSAGVTFSVPANNGSAITYYTVTSNIGGHSTTTTSTSAVVTGLTNGVTYTFTVTATNAIGTSTSSGTSNGITPATVPSAPLNLAATVQDSSIDLSWTAPASNGGSALTDYVIEYKLSSGGSWSVFSDGISTTPAATVTSLSNDNSYDFRIYAKNVIGTGVASSIVSATPGAPAQVLIQSFSNLLTPTISTNVRITNEGSIAYEYQYTWCVTDSALNQCGGGDDVFSSTAAKLIQPGENFDTALNSTVSVAGNYYFHINVQFGSDSSSANQSFTATTAGATVPDAPTIGTATAGNGQATITFSAPGSNGGSAILYYTVSSNVGGFISYTAGSPVTITGLTNGTAYSFSVTATNAIGTSSASASSNTVTPATPAAPSGGGGGGGGGGGAGASAPAAPATSGVIVGADLNGDGKVNSVDFSIMLAFWKTAAPFKNPGVDINHDGHVNSIDFSILLYQWGKKPIFIKQP